MGGNDQYNSERAGHLSTSTQRYGFVQLLRRTRRAQPGHFLTPVVAGLSDRCQLRRIDCLICEVGTHYTYV